MEVSGRREFSNGESGQSVISCQPCEREGDSLPAEAFCETCNEFICASCLKAHRKLATAKNHVIRSKDDMSTVQTRSDPCTELCTVHTTEIVKFYCQDHDFVGCGDCMVLEHKTCKVSLVADVSSNYGNSDELPKIHRRIEQLMKELYDFKKDIKNNIDDAVEMNVKTIKEIKAFRKDINAYLDGAEAELIREVDRLKNENVSQQKLLLDECELMEAEMKHFKDKVENNSDKINQLFVSAKWHKNGS